MSSKLNRVSQVAETVSTSGYKQEEEKGLKRDEILTRTDKPFYLEQHIFHIIWLGTAHIFAGYYCYLYFTGQVPWKSVLFEMFYGYFGGLGITIGCHRYWAHKSFKATLPLQILLMIMQTIADQHPIYKWCLDHRLHHKYLDTDADPHNSKRGFWFSHIGWLLLPKRNELKEKLKTFDMSDLENDPVIRFQSRWYWTLTVIFHFIIPISVFYILWEIPLLYCIAANYRRHVASLHITWCVNSVAHLWGERPYDRSISSVENGFLSFFSMGEGWHNYHHTFPWDYKASEFGWKINVSTMLIDFFAKIGWIYDLKTASQYMVNDRVRRTGDGLHTVSTMTAAATTNQDRLFKNEDDFQSKID